MKPSEELEARLTALLLGELSDDEAAGLREAIGKDPELAQLHDRLKQTIGFVREAAASPVPDGQTAVEAPKLSAERREQLLASFKTVQPRELQRPARNAVPRRELFALAAMFAALLAVGALMLGSRARENSQMPASAFTSYARRDGDEEAPVAREFEKWNEEAVVKEMRPVKMPPSEPSPLPADPANNLSVALQYAESKGVASYSIAPDPTKAPKKVADLPPPSLPTTAGGVALALQTPPPAAQLPSAADEFKSIPARRSNIVLPVVEDSLAAVAEGDKQLARKDSVERQSGLASDGRRADQPAFTGGQGVGGVGGRNGGGRGSTPAPDANAPAEPQLNWRFAGGEYAGVSGAGSDSALIPGAVPLPGLKNPVSQSVVAPNPNLKGAQLKDADLDGAVTVTNGVTIAAKFAHITPEANDSFFLSDLGGFAGRNIQSLERRNESLNQSQLGLVPLDALGDSQRSAFGRDANGSANRFYSLSDVANGRAFIEQKLEVDNDTMKRDGKLAELSDGKKLNVVTRGTALAFDVQTGKPLSGLQPEARQKLAELLTLEKALKADALSKNRVEIALPQVERGEVAEKLQVASGPVATSEPTVAANRPASVLGDVALAVEGSKRNSVARDLSEAKSLKLLSDQQTISEHDQPTGTVDREANVALKVAKLERLKTPSEPTPTDVNRPALAPTAAIPQPEIVTDDNVFSTFSLNVSDVSFKLAAASLEKGQMPNPATVRSEEFINVFDYRDPEPTGRSPIAFAWERARYPFAHDRELVRLSVKTAASGRQPGRPLNLVLLLDNSGSMERADRLRIRQECLRVLAGQLRPEDRVSVVAFARTARLWVDGLPGAQAGELAQRVGSLTPEGGTNLEDAMNLAYQTALRHFQANGVNRVVLLTDGAANLGDVEPESLKKKVEGNRRQGIALDCFGLGWDGYNDDLLEVLSRNGDGRYGFINTPEAAASDFAGQLAGALKVAASDVKVQVEWNPRRVTAYRQIGYAKHQLKKEQFRDNTVDAAEIGAAEAGNALYVVQVNPRGEGPLGTMRVRFKVPGTGDYREQEWPLAYDGAAKSLDNASPALRLAASASAFSEWLVSSPYAAEVTPDRLLGYLSGVPEQSPADPRPKKLEWMIRQAKSLSGK